ncbi:hypothetical protein WJX73_009420 [Symbiochloris irregularis]|uniref:Periodic tryptophan protein 1 n=1 Tax=Symbiochloris irregularis TaxID=706552 RepID=A0AAW1PQM7_9CHLO
MISALSWLPRGAAKALEETPLAPPGAEDIADPAEEERSTDSGDDSDEENEGDAVARARAAASALRSGTGADAAPAVRSMDAQMAELRMDQYDDEEEAGQGVFGGGNPGMSYYKSNHEDPYITLNAVDRASDSEAEDDELRDTDYVILSARNEDDVSHLEAWVYEDADEDNGNLYVHHDILLPEFPLCLTWLDCPPSSSGRVSGNLAAVGSMGPGIEIWNLNVVDTVEPLACLGGPETSAAGEAAGDGSAEDGQKTTKKKKKKRKPALREGSHTDAVLGLAWNAAFRNVLASGSADKQVKRLLYCFLEGLTSSCTWQMSGEHRSRG